MYIIGSPVLTHISACLVLLYRITKNFRDKKLSRNVTQQYFAKKGFAKGRPSKVGRGLGIYTARADCEGVAPRGYARKCPLTHVLHSRESKMASMKIAGLPRVRQHCL